MTGSNTSIRTKTRHPADFFTYVAIYVCAILSVALLLGIIVYVFVKGIRSVNWEFLTSVTSVLKGTTGIAGNIVNTLYIIIVPIIGLFLGKCPRLLIWLCAAAAVAGFYLLCIRSDFTVSKGDLLVLAGAAFFAVHIMVIDSFNARGVNGVLMSCIQFFTAGALMTVCMFFFETPVLSEIYSARFTIVYAGVMSCGVAYTLQILGQRRTEPAAATMLMSLESVFAALAGWVILHEALSYRELCGCGLVFAAVLAVQLLPEKSSVKNNVASR